MRLLKKALRGLLLLAVLAVGVGLYFVAYPNLPDYEAPEALHYLEQWDDAQRQTYYYTPQGTQVKGLEYDWFLALELPFGRDRFAAPEYLARFGFLVDPGQQPTALNPGNLPVGFQPSPAPGSPGAPLGRASPAMKTTKPAAPIWT